MRLTVVREEGAWASVLKQFERADCFHTWDFSRIDAMHHDHKHFGVLVATESASLFLPLMERRIPGYGALKDLTSAYGYPGPLYRGPVSDFQGVWNAIKVGLADMGYVSLFSRCNPFAFRMSECRGEDFSRCGSVVAIDLSRPHEEQWRCYRQNFRTDIRKAAKHGLVCHRGGIADVNAFLSLYGKTMDRVRASDTYYFSREYVVSMLNAPSYDCRLYLCKTGGQVVSAGMFIFSNGIVHYHLSGNDPHAAIPGGTKLLVDSVREIAANEGCSLFNLGGGLGGKKDTLYEFKRGFSDIEFDFYVIKSILMPDAYREVSLSRGLGAESAGDYFPAYRSNGSSS